MVPLGRDEALLEQIEDGSAVVAAEQRDELRYVLRPDGREPLVFAVATDRRSRRSEILAIDVQIAARVNVGPQVP